MAETEKTNSKSQGTKLELSEEDKKNLGFDLYPERRSNVSSFGIFSSLFQGSVYAKKKRCERSILEAIDKNHVVKTLMGALESAGCPVDLKRHIVCEECDFQVNGGYDQEFNQIVVCENSYKSRQMTDSILIHEMIHMFDNCVSEMDIRNLYHLACTEVRAANIAHCSFLTSMILGQSSPISIKRTHRFCVKTRAAQSMMVARNMDMLTALKYIDKVFDKCYNDLEPIGRRIRRNSADPQLVFWESEHYGHRTGWFPRDE